MQCRVCKKDSETPEFCPDCGEPYLEDTRANTILIICLILGTLLPLAVIWWLNR